MAMPGRTYAVGGHKYKYGFNGKELDDEIAEGDYDFDERMYDSRIGRFFSTDPCEEDYPSFSPYCFAANNPILFVDVDGCGPGNPWLEALSVALDFVPGVGTVKNLVEAAVGYDLAGNKLEAWERIAMIVPGGALANKAFKAGKAVVKQVLKHADDIARISKKVFTKVVSNINNKLVASITKRGKLGEEITQGVLEKKNGKGNVMEQVQAISNDGIPARLDHVEVDHVNKTIGSKFETKTGSAKLSDGQRDINEVGGILTDKRLKGYKNIEIKPGGLKEVRIKSTRLLRKIIGKKIKSSGSSFIKKIKSRVGKIRRRYKVGKIRRVKSKF